jgi:hypothetical protein
MPIIKATKAEKNIISLEIIKKQNEVKVNTFYLKEVIIKKPVD